MLNKRENGCSGHSLIFKDIIFKKGIITDFKYNIKTLAFQQ